MTIEKQTPWDAALIVKTLLELKARQDGENLTVRAERDGDIIRVSTVKKSPAP